jgi:hypothetical protein
MHFADDDFSPVSETLLFRLYDANRSGLPLPIAEIPAHLRPNVALYCYRRGHLEETAAVGFKVTVPAGVTADGTGMKQPV